MNEIYVGVGRVRVNEVKELEDASKVYKTHFLKLLNQQHREFDDHRALADSWADFDWNITEQYFIKTNRT